MRKVIFSAVIATVSILCGQARADDWFDDKPMPIDLDYNPASVNGIYDIDRLIIKEGPDIILDSDDDYAVEDDRGELCVYFNPRENSLEVSFKMQMSGPVFKKGSALAQYSFVYDKKSFELPDEPTASLGEKLEKVGLTVYTREDAKLEATYGDGKTLVIFLEKESDRVKEISPSRYLFL